MPGIRDRREARQSLAEARQSRVRSVAQDVLLTSGKPDNYSSSRGREQDNDTPFIWSSLWTAGRGQQVINCELIVTGTGTATLRCGYGAGAVIRSQCVGSAGAAVALSETWKTALVEQGFRVVPRTELSLSPMAVRAASAAENWFKAGADVAAISATTTGAGGPDTPVPLAGDSDERMRVSS
jgi:hypothetical protein